MLGRIVIGVALATAGASVAYAQGSEPRLLIPGPGGAPPAAPAPAPAVPPPTGAAVPGAVSPAAPAPNAASARLEVRMSQLEQDLRAVTGRLEDVSYQLRKLDDRLDKLTSDMEYRFSQLKPGDAAAPAAGEAAARTDGATAAPAAAGGGAVAGAPRVAPPGSPPPAPGPAAPGGGAAPPPPASAAPKTARDQYARAFTLLEQRNYEEAAAGFSAFLKANPDDPLADNARYWLGESYFARGEYARSAELFLEGYDKNKTGPKAPDTLLKLGLSLAGLDKKKEACASFRELNRAFPNAPDAVKKRAAQEGKRLGCA